MCPKDADRMTNSFNHDQMLKIIQNRHQPQAEEIIAEEQAGFRAGRSTTEQLEQVPGGARISPAGAIS